MSHTERAVEAQRAHQRLQSEATAKMRERDEHIIAMYVDDGLSCPQIARELGLSTSLVRILVRGIDRAAPAQVRDLA